MKYLRFFVAAALGAAALLWTSEPLSSRSAPAVREPVSSTSATDLWLAPGAGDVASRAGLAAAVAALATGRAGDAEAAFAAAVNDAVLGDYALLFAGRAQLAASRMPEAADTARKLLERGPQGFLEEAALGLAADAAVAAGQPAGAQPYLQRLADLPDRAAPAAVLLRLGRTALEAGDRAAAVRAFTTMYFDYPVAPETVDATRALIELGAVPSKATDQTYDRMLSRAEKLFAAKLVVDARNAFTSLKAAARAQDKRLVDLRLAELDFLQKRYQAALALLRADILRGAPLAAEAEYYYISTLRELGRTSEYVSRVTTFADRNAGSPWAERALNELGTFYILANDDKSAAQVFTEQYRRFPTGAFAERAAWKAGWWAYRTAEFAKTASIFESASVGLRRADFRPAWLYWSARAHLQQNHVQVAADGYARAIGDYRNTYYGRLAMRDSEQIEAARRPSGAGPVTPASRIVAAAITGGARPANSTLIQHLLAAAMYDEALGELRRVQAAGGNSPIVEASMAYAWNRQGRLRPAIQAMRRAYPQFLAAGGEDLPREILMMIYPVDHWELLQRRAAEQLLDRFLVAALVAQESTFQADVRSAANAWGLMQIIPDTGRRYAQRLGIAPFSTSRLTDPEVNVLIGTTYFGDLVRRFGDVAPALAGYNAGEGRAARWLAEKPDLPREEWIDDIPYPETQFYVKRIIGTAEDYRQLYR